MASERCRTIFGPKCKLKMRRLNGMLGSLKPRAAPPALRPVKTTPFTLPFLFKLMQVMALAVSLTLPPVAVNAQTISEFVANSTSTTFVDEDGDASDWIEITNATAGAVDLAGWYLTDDPDDLTKWSFPAPASLSANGFLVVFASGKDRAVSGAELHTNFALGSGGEFLGLVKADGVTVASQFAPAFPTQLQDVSYGTGIAAIPEETLLIEPGADCRWLVPTGEIGNGWKLPNFDDSTWDAALTGIGFDYDELTGAGGNVQ